MKRVDIDQIDKYAFLPQCADNQFVPDKIVSIYNPKNKKHQIIRYEETRKELVRSMIYSSQILINRVAFFNNDVFLDFYGNAKDRTSLISLFNNKRIVPVLHNEEEFTKNEIITKNTFTLNESIEQFFSFLESEVKDSDLFYLTTTKNKEAMDRIISFFPLLRGWLQTISTDDTKLLAKELNFGKHEDQNYINQFQKHLRKIASEWVTYELEAKDKNMPEPFGREQYYSKWIVEDDSDPVSMYIDNKKPFAVELKKIFDLSYCYNLAASYDRYFFCPEGMPTPLVIPGALRASSYISKDSKDHKEALEKEELIYKAQKTYSIPNAIKLSLSQVVAIQSTEEWQNFIKHQRRLFKDPSLWNKYAVEEYAKILGNLYLKIKTDYKDFPFFNNVYFGVKIVVKFSKILSEFIDMNESKKIIDAIDQMIVLADNFKDQAITGIVKVKHFIFDEKNNIIEEFSTGLSEIELEKKDLDELKRNYQSVELIRKSQKEGVVQQ